MKTAQEATYGKLAIDKIKKLFEDELTEWERYDIVKWMVNKIDGSKNKNSEFQDNTVLPYYNEFENINWFQTSTIEDFIE